MTRKEQSNSQEDTWDQLAQELLGEKAVKREAEEVDESAAAGAAEPLPEPTEPEVIEVAPESEAPREPLELPKPQGLEEIPLQADEAAPPTSEMESTETIVGAASEFPVEIAPVVSPTEAESTDDVETLDEDVYSAEPTGASEQADLSEALPDKPRRTRRGRRRRSRRASAESAEVEAGRESAEDDESQIDFEEATVPDDGEDEQLSAAEHAAKAKAIPTWAEAISYLSPGPEEGTGKKEGGSRPRRRRRRGKSSQS